MRRLGRIRAALASAARDPYWPTAKWWVASVTGVGTIATTGITDGWHKPLAIAVVGFVVQRVTSYITRNAPDS